MAGKKWPQSQLTCLGTNGERERVWRDREVGAMTVGRRRQRVPNGTGIMPEVRGLEDMNLRKKPAIF